MSRRRGLVITFSIIRCGRWGLDFVALSRLFIEGVAVIDVWLEIGVNLYWVDQFTLRMLLDRGSNFDFELECFSV